MRTPLIAGNWKMNLLQAQAAGLARDVHSATQTVSGVDVVVCPPFTALNVVAVALSGSHVGLGGQNCYAKESGAYTGEVSPQMLRDAGCQWVILGHSERRHEFGESDGLINRKLRFALDSGLLVMFCVGETLEERESDNTEDVLRRQVLAGLEGIEAGQFKKFAIAYEPVWAIGTGKTASPEQAQDAHAFIRGLVRDNWDEQVAAALRIQYGGSVKADNAQDLLSQADVDGALVGGASLKAADFAAIVHAGARVGARA